MSSTVPPRIAAAAAKRLADAMPQIAHSMSVIEEGRPGNAEPDFNRRVQVCQVRSDIPLDEARRLVAKPNAGAEAIWGKTVDFVDVAFFERGRRAANAVARIITKDGAALGTGFLISPRLLMTNNHVIGSKAAATGLVAEFDFERDINGAMRPVTRFAFDATACFLTNSEDNLDYTVIALGERVMGGRNLASFGYLPVSSARNKHQLGDYVNIIQHPDGRPKEAVIRENQLVARSGTTLAYVADTEPGASGSPVCNVMWALVAIHHWGAPHRELKDENGKPIPKSVNEGIRASSIHSDLSTLRSALDVQQQTLLDEALRLGLEESTRSSVADERSRTEAHNGSTTSASVAVAEDGSATWNIPLLVSVRLGMPPLTSISPVRNVANAIQPQLTSAAAEAKLEVDPDYSNRSGYDRGFLGVEIPLPKLSRAQQAVAARNLRAGRREDPFELKYHHYSVIMNGDRRLAFVSAVNIDGSSSKDFNRSTGVISDPMAESGDESEAAELWFPEDRIQEHQQTPRDFYEGQTAFDRHGKPIEDRRSSAHRNRMFQKGHLTRRQDPLWGEDDEVIRFANADTFHVTNCSPQVGFFNMGIRKRADSEAKKSPGLHAGGQLYWRALEDFVLTNARADRQKVSVFTGCVFDEGEDIPWDRGRQDMRGFKAPRKFWKVLLRVEGGALRATALVADQSPLIDAVPEALLRGEALPKPLRYDKVAKYHFSIPELEELTGLDFGSSVRSADTYPATRGAGHHEIRRVEDVVLTQPVRRPRKGAGRKAKARKAE